MGKGVTRVLQSLGEKEPPRFKVEYDCAVWSILIVPSHKPVEGKSLSGTVVVESDQ
jgi:hypothetical protein